MTSTPNKGKKKTDTMPKNQGIVDEEMSFTGNIIKDKNSPSKALFGIKPLNPFAQKPFVPKKKLVSIETLMKHTGSKEELYRTLTMRGQIVLPSLRNTSMQFLRDILSGKKQFFMQCEIVPIKVPLCAELTVERVLDQVKHHNHIMEYLPDLSENGKKYIERDFLFAIVNTIDQMYFIEALAELEERRATKAHQEAQSFIEIDSRLYALLQSAQSRMSSTKLAASKRSMNQLMNTSFLKRRKPVIRPEVMALNAQMKPKPKLESDEKERQLLLDKISTTFLSKRAFE